MKIKFDERIVKCIRKRTKEQRYLKFELGLRYFFLNTDNSDITMDDLVYLDEVKHAIIIFMSKDISSKINSTFLDNAKSEFYEGITNLKKRHPNIPIIDIVLFMEDYYFNDDKGEN